MKIDLRLFELSPKEEATFLRLLELGAQPVSVIAKHMQTARSSMYLILERLKKAGLIEHFERRGIKYVKALSPENIAHLLENRKLKAQQDLASFEKAIPHLKELENKLSITPKVRFYEGVSEVEQMYQKLMKLDGYWAYFNPASLKNILPKYFYDLPREYIRRKVHAREIMVNCPEAQEYAKTHKSKYYQFKILPNPQVFYSDMLITEDSMFLMSYGSENQVCGTEIFDPALAQSQRTGFQTLWDKI